MKTITLQQLIDANACTEQLELFKKYFNEEVEVTLETALKYVQIFDFYWTADNLLDDTARTLYDETCDTARTLYDETRDTAMTLYDETRAIAFVDAYNS